MGGITPTTKPEQPLITDDVNTLLVKTTHAINAQARLGFAFAPSAQDTPNMTVRLEAGYIPPSTEVAAQSTGTITAPSANPRIDLVAVDNATGAASVITGTEAASPAAPALTSGKSLVALVALAVGQTSITNADLTDVRNLGLLGLGTAALLDAGTDEGDLVQVLTGGKLPALSAENLTNLPSTGDDLAVRNALRLAILGTDAATAIPGGWLDVFASDTMETKTNATYASSTDLYTNEGAESAITGLTAIASTEYAGYPASNLVDGNPATFWFGTSTANQVVTISFSAQRITKYTMLPPYGYPERAPTAWTVDLYIDGAWEINVDSRSAQTGWANGVMREFELSQVYDDAEKIRLNMTTPNGGNLLGSGDITPYTQADPTNMTLVSTAFTAGEVTDALTAHILHKAIDEVTLNTDIKVRATANDGTNWSDYGTLESLGVTVSGFTQLKASFTGLTSGTAPKIEITTPTAKTQQVRGLVQLTE